jgi:hypothetical protein
LKRIRERLGEFHLSLSEEKTKIVYCWKGNRPTDVGEGCDRSFDFLGFTFRPRYMAKRAGGKGGGLWIFHPGISHKSEKRITATLRERNRSVIPSFCGMSGFASWSLHTEGFDGRFGQVASGASLVAGVGRLAASDRASRFGMPPSDRSIVLRGGHRMG